MFPFPPQPDSNEKWIVPVDEGLECEQQYWKCLSIYKVPPYITDLNPNAYQPQVISFGPYHHNEFRLHPMEGHKHRALLHFLKRSGKSFECFLESLKKVVRELEGSYESLDLKWKECTGDQFLKLMITDGYFTLEIMRTATKNNDYASNDPIFSVHRLNYIVPYMLFAIEDDGREHRHNSTRIQCADFNPTTQDDIVDDVNKLILKFYYPDRNINVLGRCLRVMDVFRKGLLMEPSEGRPLRKNVRAEATEKTEPIIRSATELNRAWIRLRKTNSLKDIFFASGVLKLPVIKVEVATESLFLNAMMFERLHIGAGNEVTSYVTFMDKIINNEEDVALLRAQDIIHNDTRSDEAVVKLFNSLCREVMLPSNSSLNAVQESINEYCYKRRTKWLCGLSDYLAYFNTPWATLSLIFTIILSFLP
ncbi:hypothetical protein BT93_L0183 [Corymbia citriodora subsp. variegata]|uniref:Uncharacterized protein n=1 Tax=Corymbia citriodora subsp. variegata TaxID=360336 RepID=A0A8T0CQE0_CORYI|nr:hypothetical protein BT93_L0183 [Corymbia citriodora subsp. variegata]